MRIIKQNLEVYIYHNKTWYIDWRKNDKLHREDGPARTLNAGIKSYHLDGRYCLKDEDEEYWKRIHENY